MEKDNSGEQITQLLRVLAAAGRPGDRLPSVRALTARHHVSPITVQRALTRLAAEGLVEPRPGQGTFVAAPPGITVGGDYSWQSGALGAGRGEDGSLSALLAPAATEAIALGQGYLPPELQARDLLARAVRQLAPRYDLWDRRPVEGDEALRAWFARAVAGDRSVTPRDVLICSGGQAAISQTFRALAAPGEPILMESPTYLGAIAAARAAGLSPIPVPADGDGVRPDLLALAFRRTGTRLFYAQPTFANPTGLSWSPSRRTAVLAVVEEASAFLVEDDAARDLAIDAAPAPLAAGDPAGHVVLIRSLAKATVPGLRIAAIIARGPVRIRLQQARARDDSFVSGFLQELGLAIVSAPAWPRHLAALRRALAERRDSLIAALAAEVPELRIAHRPAGGLHLWAALPDQLSERRIADEALREKVTVSPGAVWFPGEAAAPCLRLSYGAAPPLLREGAARLGRALRRVRDGAQGD